MKSVHAGFTLIELMLVVAIIGIVSAVATPGVKELLNNQKLRSASFDLVTSVMFARSEAIKFGGATNASVSIKAIDDEFGSGWCVIYRSTAGSDCDLDAPGATVMQISSPIAGATYTWKTTAGVITFGHAGRTTDSDAAIPAKIEISDPQGYASPRCVTIDVSGNAIAKAGACT